MNVITYYHDRLTQVVTTEIMEVKHGFLDYEQYFLTNQMTADELIEWHPLHTLISRARQVMK